ncbi:uncharacterized protein MYCGRDRAFT_95955 [Zymoseptoria tritici IPO323]|uniref:Uncharacterized protein n=1 Tax=Zymoseptoria tritici (strain CBS 115943 / IPO323) TaxID=336722 RepID=F9XKD9_ZYMTI|nr:uncharacterized protein MYCGRDRAFT_95955 [Zymoseptoria tritici IPO323]EGP84508.1 hypothetical protein MYCGRDRAFT_95955 [Zymoseptoria tritici IPO323]
MSQNVAPWLQGLTETWEIPAGFAPPPPPVSSATHAADSLSNASIRQPKKTLSTRRGPLRTLSQSDNNSLRRLYGSSKLIPSRSFSGASDNSVLQYDTIQQRSKSASPKKQQETLEWKRRLVRGQVGYGDQTDLFGANGLENIFAQTPQKDSGAPKTRKSMHWINHPTVEAMPSSPPMWNTELDDSRYDDSVDDGKLAAVGEESEGLGQEQYEEENYEGEQYEGEQCDGRHQDEELVGEESFDSNPYGNHDNAGRELQHDQTAIFSSAQKLQAGSRAVSGQTELEEDFSPVFISKHTTVNGSVDYKALDSHMVKKSKDMHIDLQHPSQEQGGQVDDSMLPKPGNGHARSRDGGDDESRALFDESTFTDGESLSAAPDLSLSENLPTGTPETLPDRVQVGRGGFADHGSFKNRPLSASQSTTGLAANARQSSGFLSPLPIRSRPLSSDDHHAPSTPAQDIAPNEPRSRSSGSPLKLFGPHDTYTSKRLLRRLSQLDPDLSNVRSEDEDEARDEQQDEVFEDDNPDERDASYASFGSGKLNDRHFNAEITITGASDEDESRLDSDRSPGSDVPPPGMKAPLKFKLEVSPDAKDTFRVKRKASLQTSSNHSSRRSTQDHRKVSAKQQVFLKATVEDATDMVSSFIAMSPANGKKSNIPVAIGKRGPNSPFKAPTPKRRRTLHASELLSDAAEVNRSYHAQLQEAISATKSKIPQPPVSFAHPDVLAERKILRPRNPTPASHRSKSLIEAEIREATEAFAKEDPSAMEAVLDQMNTSMASGSPPTLQQQARAVATEVAKFTLRVQKASGEHQQQERKRSVTTQDFFNEAVMVMRLIREKAGRKSAGLGSVAESDQEAAGTSPSEEMGSFMGRDSEGAMLRVSRPPSREGVSGWRPRTSQHTNARVISHLRKFEEKDDTEFIAASVADIQVDGGERETENVYHEEEAFYEDDDIYDSQDEQFVAVDEHSNIRIRGPIATAPEDDSRPCSQRSAQSTQSDAQHSQATNTTSSTSRSINTSGTKKSAENVGNLAPDAVAHLIGEQVGSMVYDREKKQWVKVRAVSVVKEKAQKQKRGYGSFREPPSSNITSDDDPFGEISDLPVDERREQEEIRRVSAARSRRASTFDGKGEVESRVTSQETVLARPTTADSAHVSSRYTHSSKHTAFGSSHQAETETRVTSWGDEELESLAKEGRTVEEQQPLKYAAAQAALSLEKQARSILAARNADESGQEDEMVDNTDFAYEHDHNALQQLRDDTAVEDDDSDIADLASPKLRQTPARTPYGTQKMKQNNRQVSLRRQTLTNKIAHHEGREHSEVSFIAALPGERMMSVNLSVSRPLTQRHPQGQIVEMSSPSRSLERPFFFSDLPEFTISEEDEERPSEKHLARRLAQHAIDEMDDRYALAVKDLVKTLTDVYEHEPYWEEMKSLDLRSRGVNSLHGLEDFCGRAQSMDVSNNALSYLNGAPVTVRQLTARDNQLSSLTGWTHLMNLQYLDISGNRLDNLDALGCLVHLRELRAENNEIADMSGIMGLDGLLKLNLKGNSMTGVLDFEGCQLQRLDELDLSNNSIKQVRGLESLRSLEKLNLDNNSLSLPLGSQNHPLRRLTHLSLRSCGLKTLNVAGLQSLTTLRLHGNSIASIAGLYNALPNLTHLSLTSQILPASTPCTLLSKPLPSTLRALNLSNTTLPSTLVLPLTPQPNVQCLDLSSCGIYVLPLDFGILFPGLRKLNLSDNGLKDIRPLLNLASLEELDLRRCRVERFRLSVGVVSRLKALKRVNFRGCGVVNGFYPSSAKDIIGVGKGEVVKRDAQLDDGKEAEEDDWTIHADMHSREPEDVEALESADALHLTRLDPETRLRRNVYEVLMRYAGANLEVLDGKRIDDGPRGMQVSADRDNDAIWMRLKELGVLKVVERERRVLMEK